MVKACFLIIMPILRRIRFFQTFNIKLRTLKLENLTS